MKTRLPVQPIENQASHPSTNSRLRSLCEKSHPAVAAEALSALEAGAVWEVLRDVSPTLRTEIFSHLDPNLQVEMVGTLPRADIARLLSDMPPDDRAIYFVACQRNTAMPSCQPWLKPNAKTFAA